MSDLKFKSTIEPLKLKQIFQLAEDNNLEALTREQVGQFLSKKLVNFILSGRIGRGFYLENKKGELVAGVIVTHHRAMYKEPSKNQSAFPDPSTFGIAPISGLRISHIYVRDDYREEGVTTRLIKKTIDHLEDELLQKELTKSPDRPDGFKQMVTNSEGKIDQSLADYHLSKKYFWFLHSNCENVFEKFGFRAYPLEGYKIPASFLKSETINLIEKMLDKDIKHDVGKTLKLIDVSDNTDRDMVRLLLQDIELEIISQLNKSTYHTDLSGGIRSSLSLTNVESAISAAKMGSFNELSAISEQMADTSISESRPSSSERRTSSAFLVGVPRFCLLPDYSYGEIGSEFEEFVAEKDTSKDLKYASIQGAILTNELQTKTFYILWRIINGTQFHIIGMGELKMNAVGAVGALGGVPPIRRRGSSFSGINDMGGFNFQDLDILVSTALYVANKKFTDGKKMSVHVSVNDLPMTIPTPVLHDFFTSYMPQRLYNVSENSTKEDAIEYIADFKVYKLLPMLKKYGKPNLATEIDWIRNSLMYK